MGLPMAKNLAAATAGSEGGGEVHVYDLNAGAVSDAASSGCVAAADASSAVRGAKVIVSSLPRSSDVLTVVQSMVTDSSNPELFAKGAIWVDTTSGVRPTILKLSPLRFVDSRNTDDGTLDTLRRGGSAHPISVLCRFMLTYADSDDSFTSHPLLGTSI